jgi:hypothetical protein
LTSPHKSPHFSLLSSTYSFFLSSLCTFILILTVNKLLASYWHRCVWTNKWLCNVCSVYLIKLLNTVMIYVFKSDQTVLKSFTKFGKSNFKNNISINHNWLLPISLPTSLCCLPLLPVSSLKERKNLFKVIWLKVASINISCSTEHDLHPLPMALFLFVIEWNKSFFKSKWVTFQENNFQNTSKRR